jgi:ArsR family transcriptional regulator
LPNTIKVERFKTKFKQVFSFIDTFASINVIFVELKQLEKISKALGDATRIKILMGMAKCNGSFQCANIKNITKLAQPSVSHHIKTLIEAGLIEPEKDGRNYSYVLNKSLVKSFITTIGKLAEK